MGAWMHKPITVHGFISLLWNDSSMPMFENGKNAPYAVKLSLEDSEGSLGG